MISFMIVLSTILVKVWRKICELVGGMGVPMNKKNQVRKPASLKVRAAIIVVSRTYPANPTCVVSGKAIRTSS